tara:strand:+ start:591 stop:848 length:258 start_codon:yes stop_codon:yes gene_type:complete
MVSEHDCATGITTEREMTDEEMAGLEASRQESIKQLEAENVQAVAANAKLAATREKFLGMGLSQEEVELIVPADQRVHDMEALVA